MWLEISAAVVIWRSRICGKAGAAVKNEAEAKGLQEQLQKSSEKQSMEVNMAMLDRSKGFIDFRYEADEDFMSVRKIR